MKIVLYVDHPKLGTSLVTKAYCFVVDWPVVPREGERIEIANPADAAKGRTMYFVQVHRIVHALGLKEIQVMCRLENKNNWDDLAHLPKELM